jgi:hypothetical protein
MTIEELESQDWARAARFYSQSPDGEWDGEAELACSLMPEILALVEAAMEDDEKRFKGSFLVSPTIKAVRAFNTKLETL